MSKPPPATSQPASGDPQAMIDDLRWRLAEVERENRALRAAQSAVQANQPAIEDITARKQAEAAWLQQRSELQEKTETLAKILDNIPIAVFIKDARQNFKVTLWNRAAERIFQVPRADILGKTAFDLWPREQAEIYQAADRLVASGRRLVEIAEEPSQTRDRGTILLHTIKLPLASSADGEVDFLLCLCEDISERKRLEEGLRHSQKMEAIGQLTGHIAHDFNNLLAVVEGYSGLLLGKLPVGDERRHMAEGIQSAAARGGALVRQLLIFGRKHIVQKNSVSIDAIVIEVAKQIALLSEARIDIITQCEAKHSRVLADADQMHQLVLNLAINAKDAMPSGGRLTLATAQVEIDEAMAAQLVGVKPGAYIKLVVEDSGIGMDAETQRHIFEPFYSTKQRGEGTGLGLAIVHGIVAESRGHVAVRSRPGEGTAFSILLPQWIDHAQISHAAPALPLQSKPVSGMVLVVDDDKALRTMFCELLTAAGFVAESAECGQDALDRCASGGGSIHIVLTDIDMPDMNGMELAQEIRRRHPAIQVVLMSGYPREQVLGEINDGRGITFLPKPIRGSTLARTLSGLLEDSQII